MAKHTVRLTPVGVWKPSESVVLKALNTRSDIQIIDVTRWPFTSNYKVTFTTLSLSSKEAWQQELQTDFLKFLTASEGVIGDITNIFDSVGTNALIIGATALILYILTMRFIIKGT